MEQIRRTTRDGQVLVRELLTVVLDHDQATPRDRVAAARVLLEWGFSKPMPDLAEAKDGKPLIPVQVLQAWLMRARPGTTT